MSKRIYLSGNTINCYENFTLVCTKDFDNTYFTDNYSLVDDEEYFDAEFESLEVLEDNYESKIEELNDKVADLEAKLAESEKNYAELFCRNTELETLYSQKTALLNFYKDTDLVKENTKLKQQLADKQKEIEKLKTTNDRLYKKNKKLENQIVESNIRFYKKGGIEQLEKVKEYINTSDEIFTEYYGAMERNILLKFIDNQIKELKKEMK